MQNHVTQTTRKSASNQPLKYNRLPFKPITMALAGGHQRNLLFFWLLVCLFAIPSALLTTMLDWTGIPVDIAGVRIHLSIYLPLIVCIPLVLWMGFLWGAIPSYLSTVAVAYYSGLPLQWTFIFAFANPLGLAIYTLVYRVTALRIDLSNFHSILGFACVSLLSAMTGSLGSFVWGRMVQRGMTDTYPVWQGWWLGGWITALFVVAPILFLFTQSILKKINAPQPKKVSLMVWRRKFILALLVAAGTLISYVLIARSFGIAGANEALEYVQDEEVRRTILNAMDSLAYPIFVLLGVLITCCYFTYRAVNYWSAELITANKKLALNNRQLAKLASTDALTKIANRRSIMEKLDNIVTRSIRESLPLSIIMVDADNFKRINDTFGHIVGDAILQQLSQRMLGQLRKYDHIGRYGGEEFIIILPNSQLNASLTIAERLRRCIEISAFTSGSVEVSMTISIGLAQLTPKEKSVMAFVDRADHALLESKKNGRNRITVADSIAG